MHSNHQRIGEYLAALQLHMRQQRLWSEVPPAPEALASTEPFACDTLLFSEWLQFVFIPRMGFLVAAKSPLPQRCDVAPMAEEFFRTRDAEGAAVVDVLRKIDRLLTTGGVNGQS